MSAHDINVGILLGETIEVQLASCSGPEGSKRLVMQATPQITSTSVVYRVLARTPEDEERQLLVQTTDLRIAVEVYNDAF